MTDIITHTKMILRIISKRYDIDYEDLYNLICLELKYDKMILPEETDENISNCFAYVKHRGNNELSRCNRGKTVGNFCKPHFSLFEENSLPHGFYQLREPMETEKIIINNKAYLYEKLKRKIYTIPEDNTLPTFVGYLNEQKTNILR
jgi:hypothetical protein